MEIFLVGGWEKKQENVGRRRRRRRRRLEDVVEEFMSSSVGTADALDPLGRPAHSERVAEESHWPARRPMIVDHHRRRLPGQECSTREDRGQSRCRPHRTSTRLGKTENSVDGPRRRPFAFYVSFLDGFNSFFFVFFFGGFFFSKFFGSCPMPMADDLIIVRPFPFFCVIFFPFQSRNRSRTRKNRKKRTKKSHFQRGKQNTVTSTPIPVTAKEQWSNCIWQHQPEPLPANPKFACAIFDDHFDDNNNNNNSVKTLDQLVVRPFIEEKELH